MEAFCDIYRGWELNKPSMENAIGKKNCYKLGYAFKNVILSSKDKKSTQTEKNSVLSFLQEVKDEISMIEWPTIDRLSKQFVIVVISLVFSSLLIFSVDGFFATVSKYLFEGKQ